MKSRTIAIAHTFGRYTLHAFGVAFFLIGMQLAADGVRCVLQSERDD
jgi:hypothetical protein